jgi:hypothetical protein
MEENMTTISGILEGKSGNYYKLEDAGEEAFTILEDLDPSSTEIRIENVPNKEAGKKDNTYYHILVGLGVAQKDLSVTFTALKQLSFVMPRTENWKGYMFRYLGSKGSGKNIKYQFQVIGKAAPGTQTQFAPPAQDAMSLVLHGLRQHPNGLNNSDFAELMITHTGTPGKSLDLQDKLKKEGRILQDPNGMWRAT